MGFYSKERFMKRKTLLVLMVLFALAAGQAAIAQEAGDASGSSGLKYFAAALAVGLSCIAGGIAVGRIGSAAMGAMSENADLSGKALPFAGLAEGICLWGFLVALLILIL
jgi:V/A-type H+-transporting ATPase subunit K